MPDPVEIASWWDSSGIRTAIVAVLSGGGVQGLNMLFRWRTESVEIEGKRITNVAALVAEWKRLYDEERAARAQDKKECIELINKLRDRIETLVNAAVEQKALGPKEVA